MCCLIYKFLLILTQKMQISFLKILPENALKFVSKKMRICVKNFAQLQFETMIDKMRTSVNAGDNILCPHEPEAPKELNGGKFGVKVVIPARLKM